MRMKTAPGRLAVAFLAETAPPRAYAGGGVVVDAVAAFGSTFRFSIPRVRRPPTSPPAFVVDRRPSSPFPPELPATSPASFVSLGASSTTASSSSTLRRTKILKTYDPAVDFECRPSSEWPFDADDMRRTDEDSDSTFYATPRLVKHVDEWAILSMASNYGEEISDAFERKKKAKKSGREDGGDGDGGVDDDDDGDCRLDVLDLCSSWISHIPPEVEDSLRFVAGVGMNEEELDANPQLDARCVQDLNVDPSLSRSFDDGSFDVVLMALSVDYLTDPRAVFREIHRVLRPGGVVLVTISNRYFKKKAVKVWLDADEGGKRDVVASYLYHSAEWRSIEAMDIKLKPSFDAIVEFVRKQNLFRWFATAIFRGTWVTDRIFCVKAVK